MRMQEGWSKIKKRTEYPRTSRRKATDWEGNNLGRGKRR
jgi:hypothetical protein